MDGNGEIDFGEFEKMMTYLVKHKVQQIDVDLSPEEIDKMQKRHSLRMPTF